MPRAEVAEILSAHIEQGTTYEGKSVATVPAAHYTDPERWAQEVDLIFKRLPLMLALSAEVALKGSYKAMDVVGLPILITRDLAGTVHCFLNRCAHRGAPLMQEGTGRGHRFTCPYHGWTYSGDGRLLSVTDNRKFGEICKADNGLAEFPCEEVGGLIFAVLSRNATIDVREYLGPMLDEVMSAGFADWSFLGSRVIQGANWKLAYDGFIEGYHFATLHPKTLAPRVHSNVAHYEAAGPHLRIAFPRIVQSARSSDKQGNEIGVEDFDFLHVLFPGLFIALSTEIGQIAQVLPGPTPESNQTTLFYVRRTPIEDAADALRVEQLIGFFRDLTYMEDYSLGLRIQKGLRAGVVPNVQFGRNERGNQFFHETVAWFLNENITAAKPVL